jgi:hypothetical protein
MRVRFKHAGALAAVLIVIAALCLDLGCGGGGSEALVSTLTAEPTPTSRTAALRPPTTPPVSPNATSHVSTARTTGVGDTSAATTTQATTATSRGATTASSATTTRASTTSLATTTSARAEMVLRVAGSSVTKTFTMDDLKALPATEGWGGWKNQLGNITQPTLLKGVAVRALMDTVGGGSSIVAVASDGYEQTFAAGDLNGGVSTYDPATGDVVSTIGGSLSIIIAYSEGGMAIGSGQGPLRIAFVSPGKDQVTDGSNWVKWVVEIRVQ